ncbi:MAG: 2-C-methyl-D-erythritol 4-phosphate cytidylyltransferase [bacterium]
MRAEAIVVAGGAGERMGSGVPKQFLEAAGRPLLVHALVPFQAHPDVTAITVVLPGAYLEEMRTALADRWGLDKVRGVCPGGSSRRASVRAGLESAGLEEGDPGSLVAVHDGARPLLTTGLLDALLRAAEGPGAAAPSLRVADTVVRDEGGTAGEVVDRSGLRRVQTPQVFRSDWLAEAHRAWPREREATDDAQMVRALGHPVALIEGDPMNLKVTTPRDLEMVRRCLGGGSA